MGTSSQFWTQEIVTEACRKLIAEGVSPTVWTVRKLVGQTKGSDSTVQKFIRAYRESVEAEAPAAEAAVPVPGEIDIMVGAVWQRASELAQQRLDHQRASIKEAQAQVAKERDAIEISVTAMERRVEVLEDKLAAAQEAADEAGLQAVRLETERDSLKEHADWLTGERDAAIAKAEKLAAKCERQGMELMVCRDSQHAFEQTIARQEEVIAMQRDQCKRLESVHALLERNLFAMAKRLPSESATEVLETLSAVFSRA